MFTKIKYWLRNIRLGVNNLISWFPIIWRDRNYDNSYIYTILSEKLKRQAEHIDNEKWYVGYETDVRRIRLCVKLIDKINDDFYSCEYIDYYKSSFDFVPAEKEGYSELKTTEISENFDEYFKKYPLIYNRVKNNSDSKKLIAMKIAETNQNRARKLLFKTLEENIERWWT